MNTFDTLESAITQMQKLATCWLWATESVKLHLAKSDITPVRSFADQVEKGLPFTDKQRNFADKLVYKYRKQWRKHGYDVESIHASKNTRLPLRSVVRGSWVDIKDDQIIVRFLYDRELVDQFYKMVNEKSAGKMIYDKPNKEWKVALTEENIELVRTFANKHDFNLTPSFLNMADMLVPFLDYSIELVRDGETLSINNAPESMLDWIDKSVGELSVVNMNRLCALSPMLGITLSDQIMEEVKQQFGDMHEVVLRRSSHISPNDKSLDDLTKYFTMSQPKSVVIYLPDRGAEYQYVVEHFSKAFGEAAVCNHLNKDIEKNDNAWIHITRTSINVQPELMISFSGFMFGPSRKAWVNNAGKIIYYCNTINTGLIKRVYDLR